MSAATRPEIGTNGCHAADAEYNSLQRYLIP